MRIGINLIQYRGLHGIEAFAREIIEKLILLDKDDEFILFTNQNSSVIFKFSGSNVKIIEEKFKNFSRFNLILYQQILLPRILKREKIDLLYCPSVAMPIFYKNKIVTIHDCAAFKFKNEVGFSSRIYLKMAFWSAKNFSKKIVTISEFSKNELINDYKVNPDLISVISEGVARIPDVSLDFIEKTKEKFKIENPYFFYLGNIHYRKNLIGLLESFKKFKENHNEFYLVFGGRINSCFINIREEAKRLNISNSLIQTGFISDEEKVALYKGAIAHVFPSFYEGFGLSILEAQSLGVPVLTSNITSMPEVAGKGALFVNPYSIEEIASGLEEIVFNKELRKKIINRGFENVKRFSWEFTARKMINIFEIFNNYE